MAINEEEAEQISEGGKKRHHGQRMRGPRPKGRSGRLPNSDDHQNYFRPASKSRPMVIPRRRHPNRTMSRLPTRARKALLADDTRAEGGEFPLDCNISAVHRLRIEDA